MMMFHVRLLLSLTLAMTLFSCGSDQEASTADSSQHLQRAEAYREKGQFRAAIIEARNVIKAQPDQADGYVVLARIYNDLGQGKQALAELERYTGESTADSSFETVRSLLNAEKYRSAHKLLDERGESLKSTDAHRYHLYRSSSLAGQGQLAEARSALDEAEQLEKNTETALLNAKLLMAGGLESDAITLLDAAITSDSKATQALIMRAEIAEHSGDLTTAEDRLSQALFLLPDTDILSQEKYRVLRMLTSILTKQGRSSEALVYSRVIADASPEAYRLSNELDESLGLYRQGKFDEARVILEKVYASSRSDSVGILLGLIHTQQGNYAEAEQYLATHVDTETSPVEAIKALAATQIRLDQAELFLAKLSQDDIDNISDPETLGMIAMALTNSGQADAGRAVLERALAETPDSVGVRILLARQLLRAASTDNAVALLQEGMQRSPDNEQLQGELIKAQLMAGDKTGALASASSNAARHSDSALAQFYLGQAQVRSGNRGPARAALAKAIELDAKLVPAYFALAALELAENRHAEAQQLFRTLSELAPDDPNVYKGLITALELGNREKAGHIDEAAYYGGRQNAVAQAVLAEYHLRNGRLQEAKALLDTLGQAGDAHGSYPLEVRLGWHYANAVQLTAKGQLDEARRSCLEGLALQPKDGRLIATLTNIEIKAKQYREANKLLTQLESLPIPDKSIAQALRGELLFAQQQYADAAPALQQAWRKRGGDDTANKAYLSLQRSRQAELAAAFLTEWLGKSPDNIAATMHLALQRQESGDIGAAIDAYERVLVRSEDNVIALNNLAHLYAQKKDSRALATGRKAYELAPKLPPVMDTYGWLLVQGGKREQGIAILEQALALAPGNKEIASHLQQAREQR